MSNDLVCSLFDLLKSDNIDVSYFAAGIVAHLTSDGEQAWKSWKVNKDLLNQIRFNQPKSPLQVPTYTRAEMLQALTEAVLQWKVPESEMVAYRSFKPFFPLLRVDMDHQVQLWAVWAIHHVCTKNRKCLSILI